MQKVLPCLDGGGGAELSRFVAPLPVINDQSLYSTWIFNQNEEYSGFCNNDFF